MAKYVQQYPKSPASFRWVVVPLIMGIGIVTEVVSAAQDPWPEWQRNAARIGRADAIGPQTPTIAWTVRVDPSAIEGQQASTPVMDAEGRIFAGHHVGVTAVDSKTHEILWQFTSSSVDQGISLWNGHLLYGTPQDVFYCIDAATGNELWSVPAEPHPNRGSVVDANGVVYYPSQNNVLYARNVIDGSEVWTHNHPDFFNSAPALDGLGQLYIGDFSQWFAFDTSNGDIVWTFLSGHTPGTSPVENGRVYMASPDPRRLFCIDAVTGKEIWQFDTEFVTGGVVVGNDGTLYVNASGGSGWLFAVSPDGEEIWRYPITNQSLNHPPIVDAMGNVYFCTYFANEFGWLHAVGPDGKGLWVKEMPDQVSASPMLAPDGTLYVVCRDKFLYAFKDPSTAPDDFDAFRGFHASGTLEDLLESDDDDLCYNPGIVLNPTEAPVTLDFLGTLPNDSPATLDVTIESSANTVGLELTFSFWNYNTSSWDVVGVEGQTFAADTVRTFAGTPADHVEPGTGEVRTRYEVRVVSFIFLFPWTDCVDHVFWTVSN